MQFFKNNVVFLFFLSSLILTILLWKHSHTIQAEWSNVPPVPSIQFAGSSGLSDNQFAYRMNGIMLQNLGSVGGQGINLREYNYSQLSDWFLLQDSLDEVSNFMPFLAAYYYGAVDTPEKLRHIFDYLTVVGTRPYGDKWRWLAHGVFLARYTVKDNSKALEMAHILAQNKDPDIGVWARQLPALIYQAEGDTEEAYNVMMNILKDSIDELHPNEINFMRDYICNTILKEKPRESKPALCQ